MVEPAVDEVIVTPPVEPGDETPPEGDGVEAKTFTQEEVNAITATNKRHLREENVRLKEEKARLEGRLEVTAPAAPTQPNVDAKPNQDDFETYEEYVEALGEFSGRQGYKKAQEAGATEAGKQAAQVKEKDFMNAINTSVSKETEKYKDFDLLVRRHPEDGGPGLDGELWQQIQESELPVDVLYYFGNNPKESYRIGVLAPNQIAREIGKIEASLGASTATGTPPDTSTNAPAPPGAGVVGKGATPSVDYSKMSATEYAAVKNKERAGR